MRRFDNTRKPSASMTEDSKWKRKRPSRIYDYNYKVSEGYYKPQTEYIDHRFGNREKDPPADTHLSYAERYSTRPWYGGTRGLPYDERNSELTKPLLKPSERPRGSSLIREMHDDAMADVPLHIRAMRRKKKIEDEEIDFGIRPKDRKSKKDQSSISSMNIRDEMKRIDDELNRSMERTRRSASLTSDFGTSATVPKRISRHDVSSYTDPFSGSRVKTESSHYSSSSSSTRPPIVPRSSAREETSSTFNTSTLRHQPRSRVNSFSSDASSPIMSRKFVRQDSELSTDDELPVYSNKARKIREDRRNRESETLTDNIYKMVEKMRVRDVDPTAAYTLNRSLRAPSPGPSSRSSTRRRRKSSNSDAFVYGVGKY